MNLTLDCTLGDKYKSASQKARVMSETWVERNAFCCLCGGGLLRTANNTRVLDLVCMQCEGGFELKSTRGSFCARVPDGAFNAMMGRINNISSPSFLFLTYDKQSSNVTNLFAIPTYFFDASVIEKRRPLSDTAVRAGWVGCNIVLNRIPKVGKVFYVRDGQILQRSIVMEAWKRAAFLRHESNLEARGWTLEILRCIQSLNARQFTLPQMYEFEPKLKVRFPGNNFIREKIRQQLQVLRDAGLIVFQGKGRYSTVS